jgi:DNA mismatch repair protein MutS2
MRFRPGDAVHVVTLGTGVIREVRNGGRYLVDIKGRPLLVHEAQLAAVIPGKRRSRPPSGPGAQRAAAHGGGASLDLHGKTVDEAIEALDAFLNETLLAGHAEARVIHGRSGGRIKAAVHARLRQMAPVRSFRVDPRNAGVTIVVL